jgi:hypothetical protein
VHDITKKKTWITSFLFEEFLPLFVRSIVNGISQSNQHILILDENRSHVTLEMSNQTKH